MNNIYTDPWGYDGTVPLIAKNGCGCQDGRSDQQIEIDDKQDAEIKAEAQRSQTVDAEQNQKIDELTEKVDNIDPNDYYYTDE